MICDVADLCGPRRIAPGDELPERGAVSVGDPSVGGEPGRPFAGTLRPGQPLLRGHGDAVAQNSAETFDVVKRQVPAGRFSFQVAEGGPIGDQRGATLAQAPRR